jgi:hypothetical protein
MDAKTTVQTLLDSVQKADFETAKSLLSDEFQFSGTSPEPMNRDAWLRMSRSLKKAFPDLDYRFHVDGTDGDVVRVSAKPKGTHTNDLDVSAMNMGVVPATKKAFFNPHERGKLTVRGGKVTSWAIEPIAGGGLMGILGQLGVKSPSM